MRPKMESFGMFTLCIDVADPNAFSLLGSRSDPILQTSHYFAHAHPHM